ncbi:MAG: transcriptional repressor [Lachnospiraceae bacterium]|nr:transcriptional repressor [Lachnospiraceae bacterium]
MNNKSMYKTKQREELLEYLISVQGEHITVGDIRTYFERKGASIGVATIYRQLEKMVDEGLVTKYNIDAGSPACFEYVAGDEEHDRDVCFHCKCEKCGKLIHLHCEELEEMQGHLKNEHEFRLNPMRTVLYGICSDCEEKAEDADPVTE